MESLTRFDRALHLFLIVTFWIGIVVAFVVLLDHAGMCLVRR